MTDHPSNPPSQRREEIIWFEARVAELEAALAAQEARHKAEMNESHETNRLAISAQRALSNLEHKTRLELRETESKLLRLHSILAWYEEKHQQRLKQVYEAESKFLEAQAHVRNHHLEACETCIANESTTLALESKLREATEREKALREALKSLMNDDGSSASLPAHDTRCVLALAAIRSGPAQETPPRICRFCKMDARALGPIGMWQHCPENEGGSLQHDWPEQETPKLEEGR